MNEVEPREDAIERQRQWLHCEWSRPAQRAYNQSTVTCPDCHGLGYRVIRKPGQAPVRELVGCPTCGGLGKIPKEGVTHAVGK